MRTPGGRSAGRSIPKQLWEGAKERRREDPLQGMELIDYHGFCVEGKTDRFLSKSCLFRNTSFVN